MSIKYPPELTADLARCVPVYDELEGWSDDLTHVRQFSDLPEAACRYVSYLEEKIGVPIEYVSVGPGREQTFKK